MKQKENWWLRVARQITILICDSNYIEMKLEIKPHIKGIFLF